MGKKAREAQATDPVEHKPARACDCATCMRKLQGPAKRVGIFEGLERRPLAGGGHGDGGDDAAHRQAPAAMGAAATLTDGRATTTIQRLGRLMP
jgi:hypothetical protein